MEHIFLVPILVFLHAGFSPASAAEELPPPELSVDPKFDRYYEGENVKLSCVAKINKKVKEYRFNTPRGTVAPELVNVGYWSGLLYVTVQKERNETYSCEYQTENVNEISLRSNTIALQVQEAPEKPSLTLDHTLLQYKRGDNVSLLCSAPLEAKDIVEFQYFGDRQTIQALKPPNNTDVYNLSIYSLSITELKDTGKFSCAYIQSKSDRKIRSKMSEPVFINLAHVFAVDVFAVGTGWGRILATGGTFFTINGLIFLITHYHFLPKVS